jgi:uncharacterized membrane protein
MSCNCKADNKLNVSTTENRVKQNKLLINNIKQTSTSLLYYLFVLILGLPFINIFFIWFLFKTIVINQNVDVTNLLAIVAKKLNVKLKDEEEDNDDDDDLEILTENDVILLDVEDITENKEK